MRSWKKINHFIILTLHTLGISAQVFQKLFYIILIDSSHSVYMNQISICFTCSQLCPT